jgi:hypothetical protein
MRMLLRFRRRRRRRAEGLRSDVIARLDGQSDTHGLCLLDRPVEPGDDSEM